MSALYPRYSKNQIATAIAVFFHAVGVVGILFFDKDFFIHTTPLNLLLCLVLLVWTHTDRNKWFYFFLLVCFTLGIIVEIIGVNTGALFGNYTYGTVLGPRLKGVPWVIGINWFLVMYCCGISIHTLLRKAVATINSTEDTTPKKLRFFSVIIDGATLAVVLDWIMEPVAMKLGYWQWKNDVIPLYNYLCWFLLSVVFMLVFYYLPFKKQNKFAIHLLMIQAMFFLILRTFL